VMGLKYEDLLVETSTMETALTRIPAQDKIERERRIKRAFDLSIKRKQVYPADQTKNPLDMYLAEHMQIADSEETERELINKY